MIYNKKNKKRNFAADEGKAFMSNKRIAELAHVSTATVSKVFSGNDRISAETTAHVLRVAEENGLLPPRFKKNSLAKKTLRVAILVPEIISVYYAGIISAATKILDDAGIYSEIHITGFDTENIVRIQSVLQSDGLTDGILLVEVTHRNPDITVPVVCLDDDQIPFPDTFRIVIDSVGYMKQCIRHLTELGHDRIGFIGETKTHKRLDFFRTTAEQIQFPVREEDIFVSTCRFEEAGRDAARHFLERQKKVPGYVMPGAFLCAYDEVALGLISALTAAGVRVPEDVSVIGVNNIPAAQYGTVPLTTVDTFTDAQVSLCIHILRERMTQKMYETPPKMTIEGKLIVRNSTARAPERRKRSTDP